jgi:hypothetical protein
MTAHTPGPWQVDPTYQSPSYVRAACAALVASTSWAWGGKDLPADANARLVAAAPALLEALRAVVAAAENGDEMTAINLAEAAIARATGAPA